MNPAPIPIFTRAPLWQWHRRGEAVGEADVVGADEDVAVGADVAALVQHGVVDAGVGTAHGCEHGGDGITEHLFW